MNEPYARWMPGGFLMGSGAALATPAGFVPRSLDFGAGVTALAENSCSNRRFAAPTSAMHSRFLAISLFFLAMSFSARSEDAIDIQSTPAQIRTAQDDLKRSIDRKEGAYADLSDENRNAILRQQAVIYRLIEGRTTIEELGPNGRIELVNALESLKATLNKAEDDRMICERVKVIGSNRPQNKCMSVGERKRLRERIQREGIRTAN